MGGIWSPLAKGGGGGCAGDSCWGGFDNGRDAVGGVLDKVLLLGDGGDSIASWGIVGGAVAALFVSGGGASYMGGGWSG